MGLFSIFAQPIGGLSEIADSLAHCRPGLIKSLIVRHLCLACPTDVC